MEWEWIENPWQYPFEIKGFVFVFYFAFLLLFYYFYHHFVLAAKLKKHFKFFRKLRMDKTSSTEIGPIIDQQLNKAKNTQIKDLYLAFFALTATSAAAGEHAAQKYKKEIDYFLYRRKLQIKGLAIVLVFSMAGLILMEIKTLFTEIGCLSKVLTPQIVIPWLSQNFHYNLFQPLVFALLVTFLAFWLINSVKKLRLWLDHEWANLLEETAARERK